MMAHIELAGRRFELRPEPPKAGRLMVVARAEKRGGVGVAVAYLDLLESLLDPDHDPDEFEQAVAEMDDSELGSALEAAAKTYERDPFSPGRPSSSPSSDGQQTAPATSRVVSFSKGTVQVSEAS